MKLSRHRFLHLAAGAVALPAVSRIARAQTYPARPVRIIVGYPAGGGADINARLMGQWLSERLGQAFVIENRPGAGGTIAVDSVVRSPPDGYTLLLTGSPDSYNESLYNNLKFNYIRDIAPVAGIIRVPGVMVVHPWFPAKTVPEFIAYAKVNPGKINYASGGNGTPQHVCGELFKMMAGVEMVHVPYRGGAPAVADLLGGQGNAPHCFPRNAYAMRTFAMPASRDLDRGSAWEAVRAGSGRRQRRFWPFDFREQGSHRRCPSRCPTAAPCWTGRLDPSDATAMVAP